MAHYSGASLKHFITISAGLVLLWAITTAAATARQWTSQTHAVMRGPVKLPQQAAAQTPPMGYNTWNAYGVHIDEQLLTHTADLMVSLGLVKAGYTYLNLDDAWHAETRDPTTQRLRPHPTRFPQGVPYLVKYAKDRGMRLGLYTDVGLLTCAGYPGSLGHEAADAQSFLEWGVEYLKVDNCWADPGTVVQRYKAMGDALANSSAAHAGGAPLLYSLCSWGVGSPWRGWGRAVGGNTWRIDGDIVPHWRDVLRCADSCIGLSRFAGPGGWNDPDMLEVGNGDLNLGQQRAHFALWCVLKAPLLVGANLTKLAEPRGKPSLDILLSPELIAVNQDPLGVAGDLVWAEGLLQVWAAPLEGGARAVVVVNRQAVLEPHPPEITLMWSMLGYPSDTQVTVRDLYGRQDLAHGVQHSFTVAVRSADCVALKLSPDSSASSAPTPPTAAGSAALIAPGAVHDATTSVPTDGVIGHGHVGGDGSGEVAAARRRLLGDDGWRPWHTHHHPRVTRLHKRRRLQRHRP